MHRHGTATTEPQEQIAAEHIFPGNYIKSLEIERSIWVHFTHNAPIVVLPTAGESVVEVH
jgi:hypothetical protein